MGLTCFDFLDSLLAEDDQFVAVLPAGNFGKGFDCQPVVANLSAAHQDLRIPIDTVFLLVFGNFLCLNPPLLRLFAAHIRERCGILIAGNRLESCANFQICRFCFRLTHLAHREDVDALHAGIFVAGIDMIDIAPQGRLQLLIAKADDLLVVIIAIKRFFAFLQCLGLAHTEIHHQFAKVCLRKLRIHVQDVLTEVIRPIPLPILKEEEHTLHERGRICIRC